VNSPAAHAVQQACGPRTDHVTAQETAVKVVVTIYEDTAPKARYTLCTAISVKKTTTVNLNAEPGSRKVVDGARPRVPVM
jgi:hypothetical protein